MSHLTPEQQKARNRYPLPFEAVINPIWYATSPEMVIETEGCLSIPGFKAFAVTGRSRLKDFSRMAGGKLGPSKDGRHASFNMKSITLADGCLPIACFPERSHRPSRTVQVLRPTYSNASPFRFNCPRKNEGASHGIRRRTAHVPWLGPRRAGDAGRAHRPYRGGGARIATSCAASAN